MDFGDGEERDDYRAEDFVASGSLIFPALFVVLVPGKDENKKLPLGKTARSGGEEVPEVSPPSPKEPGAAYINHF